MNKIVKLALILFLVSAVVAGVLGATNEITKEPIAQYKLQKTAEAYAAALPEGVSADATKTADIGETVDVNGNAVTLKCVTPTSDDSMYVVEASAVGSQGIITMAIGVNKADTVCTGISIISSSETSGLGAEASKPYFKDQFAGKTSDAVHIEKQGGEIVAITGATITSKAVTNSAAAAIDYVANMG